MMCLRMGSPLRSEVAELRDERAGSRIRKVWFAQAAVEPRGMQIGDIMSQMGSVHRSRVFLAGLSVYSTRDLRFYRHTMAGGFVEYGGQG